MSDDFFQKKIKNKKKPDRLTAHTGGLVSRGDEVFLCAAVCLFDGGLTESVHAEIGCRQG